MARSPCVRQGNQAGEVVVLLALVLTLVGTLLLGYALNWRLRAQRVTGTVIGVRSARASTQKTYYTVYRYIDSMGRSVEATTSVASSGLADKQTGAMRTLLVFADHPETVREADSHVLEIAAVILIAFGLLAALFVGPTALGLDAAAGALVGWYSFRRSLRPGARADVNPPSPVMPGAPAQAAPLLQAQDILQSTEPRRRSAGAL
ncbi:MAG TPA: DUF3592 domain-containing protein, partial [Steroidobacteraceae bacterium]|nr:DUF3592 domain-containing protein [Steroidobacteraceae bacterium]